MTIAFTRLFTTQGLHCGALNETNTFRSTTLNARVVSFLAQLVTTQVYGALVSPVYTNNAQEVAAQNSYISALSAQAEAALLADVDADRPGTGVNLSTAVKELRRQMLIGSQTLNDCPGAVAVAAVGTPVGLTHQFAFGPYEPGTGLKSDFFVPDVILSECTADRSTGGVAFEETFSLVGKTADSLPTDATYPSGSGINTSVTAVDPATDQSIVQNGSFQAFSVANTPDSWTLGTSVVAGTHVFKKTADDPRGTASSDWSLRLLADGTVIIKLRQPVTLKASTAYTVHFRAKKVLDPGTDWGVTLRLVDGTAFTALAGNGAYVNSVSTVTCASMSADWVNVVTGQFLTPAVIPTTGIAVELLFSKFNDVTTAAVNTSEVYVDHVSVIETAALYAGGPTLTVFSGLTESVVGDAHTATVTLASGVPSSYLIRGIDRLLGLASLDDRIPTVAGGGETISDSLVV